MAATLRSIVAQPDAENANEALERARLAAYDHAQPVSSRWLGREAGAAHPKTGAPVVSVGHPRPGSAGRAGRGARGALSRCRFRPLGARRAQRCGTPPTALTPRPTSPPRGPSERHPQAGNRLLVLRPQPLDLLANPPYRGDMPIRAVVFDAGETLLNEARIWSGWARWLGVDDLTLMGVLGAVIERREHHHKVFEILRPGIDLEAARRARRAEGEEDRFTASDFYSDALPCLRDLRAAGYRVGVAGNTGSDVEELMRFAGHVDFVGSSASFGIEKPSPRYFARLIELADAHPFEIAYVGDRLDNDILPAVAAGIKGIHIRRGPWGYLHALRDEAQLATLRLDALSDLLASLRSLDNASGA